MLELKEPNGDQLIGSLIRNGVRSGVKQTFDSGKARVESDVIPAQVPSWEHDVHHLLSYFVTRVFGLHAPIPMVC
jgi:hypothetical protein